jgi:hypothetical protein
MLPQPEQLVDLLPQLGLQFNQALVADRMAFGRIRMDLAAIQTVTGSFTVSAPDPGLKSRPAVKYFTAGHKPGGALAL